MREVEQAPWVSGCPNGSVSHPPRANTNAARWEIRVSPRSGTGRRRSARWCRARARRFPPPRRETATSALAGRDGRTWARPQVGDVAKIGHRHASRQGPVQLDGDMGGSILDQPRVGERQHRAYRRGMGRCFGCTAAAAASDRSRAFPPPCPRRAHRWRGARPECRPSPRPWSSRSAPRATGAHHLARNHLRRLGIGKRVELRDRRHIPAADGSTITEIPARREARRVSACNAVARLVSGPVAMTTSSPGHCRERSMMKFAALRPIASRRAAAARLRPARSRRGGRTRRRTSPRAARKRPAATGTDRPARVQMPRACASSSAPTDCRRSS